MTFITKHWKLLLICILALVLIIAVSTGGASKALGAAMEQLGLTRARIADGLRTNIENYEAETTQLKEELKQVQKEKDIYKSKASQSASEVARLEGENDVLRKKLESIIVPTDVDSVVRDLNQRGFPTIKRK